MYEDLDKKRKRALQIIAVLEKAASGMQKPAAHLIIERYGKGPYLILISCILSLRTKDTVSFAASCRLFELAKTPQEMLELSLEAIKQAIYPVGFYRIKARQIHALSEDLIERFNSEVPQTREALLSLKGVGIKTANLVLGEAFNIPAICVDTHVHRISNRLGLVKTNKVEETEQQLQPVIPQEHWIAYNRLLVTWGQNRCTPLNPRCSSCPIASACARTNVIKPR